MNESPQRRAWRVTEPIHAMIYFVPEAPARYGELGVGPLDGYFASRGAAFGECGPGLVSATFYNFNPELVARALPAVWDSTTPAAMIEARLSAADEALTRGLGAEVLASAEVAEAAGLARRAAEAATAWPQGRPLFAAHAELPWPDEPHLVLWHAQTLLREFRGDGHVAALLEAGVGGIEALLLHVASGEADERFLRVSRGWRREAWSAAAERLRARGLLDGDGGLTDRGRQVRAGVEAATDRLAAPAYDAIGEQACVRLAELTRPLSRTLVKAGMLNPLSTLGGRS
ncbi:SCO6745 family protein [Actinoplanes sp. URMC 104]|uniref:SCO6745 family protein n=1 Tax=Actinoplanes sp. URMC 104 TaxID=3423409 RepID=UPI003F1B7027